jgi:glycine/D-amino acid oxidase-like deaminating enzyme
VGLSAAITLAEAGKSVVILEKDCIGDAASGRNGGHLTVGLGRWSINEIIDAFGEEVGGRVWRNVSLESMNFTDEFIERYKIPAERVFGHLTLAYHPDQVRELAVYIACMQKHGYDRLASISQASVAEYVNSPLYHGAMLDKRGGHLNPLAYVQGLASAAENITNPLDSKKLVRIYENTTAVEVDNVNKRVWTENGTVTAREAIVLGAHANTVDLSKACGSKTINMTSYQLATNPLSEETIKKLLPSGCAALDTQLVLFYYRITENKRLVFGALGEVAPLSPSKTISLLSNSLFTLFPQMKGHCTVDHMWNGTIDVTANGAVNVSND